MRSMMRARVLRGVVAGKRRDDQDFARWCFADLETAEAFRDGGSLQRPIRRGCHSCIGCTAIRLCCSG